MDYRISYLYYNAHLFISFPYSNLCFAYIFICTFRFPPSDLNGFNSVNMKLSNLNRIFATPFILFSLYYGKPTFQTNSSTEIFVFSLFLSILLLNRMFFCSFDLLTGVLCNTFFGTSLKSSK